MITNRFYLLTLLCCLSANALLAQLSGAYTINSALPTSGTNFQSFTDMASALSSEGVSDDVMINVEPGSGPYNEQVTISTIPGSSPDAFVTLNGNDETLTTLTSSDNRHVLRLDNLSYFAVANLNIDYDPNSTGGFYGIHIFGSGTSINVSYCDINIDGTTSTLYGGIVASGSETSILSAGDYEDIQILYNTSTGGGYGASVYGLANDLATGVLIANNEFYNFHSNGIYLRETNGAAIHDNFFDKNYPQVSSCNAIQLAQNENINGSIFNNRIQVSQESNGTVTFRGIYLFNGTGHKVYNNEISNIKLTSGNVVGIEIRTAGTQPEIYFNTISIDLPAATSGDLFGIKEQLSNTNSVLRNNIISISQPTTGDKSGLVIGTIANAETAFDSDYNDIYVPDGNVAQKGTFSPTYYPSLANWQSISMQDGNSLDIDPIFDTGDAAIPTNLDLDNAGTSITGVQVDLLNNPRGTPPDMGAYEFGPCAVPDTPDAVQGPNELCEGSDSVVYTINPVMGATGYNWSVPADATILTDNGTSIEVTLGAFSGVITVAAVNDCGSSDISQLPITINPLPTVSLTPPDFFCENLGDILVFGGSPEGGTYSGLGITDNILDPTIPGLGDYTYTYTYTDSLGCSASAEATTPIEICLSANDEKQLDIELYPNPVAGQLNVKGIGEMEFRLFDMDGKKLFQTTVNDQGVIDISPFGTGQFLVEIRTDKGRFVQKIISKRP